MSMTIGSTTLSNPAAADYQRDIVPIASAQRAADGTLRSDFAAVKYRWLVTSPALDSTDRNTLQTTLATLGHLSWTPPEGGSYTVRVLTAEWRVVSGTRYRCTFTLEEV